MVYLVPIFVMLRMRVVMLHAFLPALGVNPVCIPTRFYWCFHCFLCDKY
jgi:hypothetical protein